MEQRAVQRRPVLFVVVATLLFLQAFYVPANPFAPGVDGSFPHVLNLAAFSSAKFGTDVVYTYGPLGFLLQTEDIGANLFISIGFWTAGYVSLACIISYVIVSNTHGFRLAFMAILAAAAISFVDPDRLLTAIVISLLLVGYDNRPHRLILITICAALAGIGLLMKVTIGIGCLGSIFLSLFFPYSPASGIIKRSVTAALSTTASFCLGWLLTSGSLSGIAAYLDSSIEMSAGYTATMSSSRPNEAISLFLFVASIGFLLLHTALLPRARAFHSAAVLLPAVAIAWKHGVVRFDGHVASLVSVLVFSTMIVTICNCATPSPTFRFSLNRQQVSLSLAIATLVLTAVALRTGGLIDGTKYTNGFFGGWKTVTELYHFHYLRKSFEAQSIARHLHYRLSPEAVEKVGNKTIDIYSYDLGFIAANPTLNWKLKPVFQHFNAFTEKLDRLNADFLSRPTRPERLLTFHPDAASMSGIDGRHQLFDDPIAFLQILRSYRLSFIERDLKRPPIAILERDENDRFGAPQALKTEDVSWHQTIPVPPLVAPSLLRIKFELRKPFFAQIREALFRLGPLHITYLFADGSSRRYRLMPHHLSSGVLIAPLFETYWQLYAFLSGESWDGSKVTAIRLESNSSKDYRSPLSITWETISCRTDSPCKAERTRVFSRSADGAYRTPLQMPLQLVSSFKIPGEPIEYAEVKFSTYARVNRGPIDLEALDENDHVIGSATVSATDIKDNDYFPFVFTQPIRFPSDTAKFRLTYAPEPGSAIATWQSSALKADFDIRLYAASSDQ